MYRKIIKIDEDKCEGCGMCAISCKEGAIDIINGKAKLVREEFCDGFGTCLALCPRGAIILENRNAKQYDELAGNKAKHHLETKGVIHFLEFHKLIHNKEQDVKFSKLKNWPIQIKIIPIKAPFFDDADILICSDCVGYAHPNIHDEFIQDKILLVGCPKFDATDYSEKLSVIIRENRIKSITLVRMELPCCMGMQRMLEKAVEYSGKEFDISLFVISRAGKIL